MAGSRRPAAGRKQPQQQQAAGAAAAESWGAAESYGPRTVALVNIDWDRVAAAHGDGLDAALSRQTLAATLDIKKWENTLLAAQHADLQAGGVEQWLETTKRGLGLFLQIDRAGRPIISGIEHPSSASAAGLLVGSVVQAINGRPIPPQAEGVVGVLLETLCHRTVRLTISGEPVPDHHRWQPFSEFEAVTDGRALVTIEHCCCCSTNHRLAFDPKQLVTHNHDEDKYMACAVDLRAAIQQKVGPLVPVVLKAFDPQETKKTRARLGTMEVQIGWRQHGELSRRIVASKRVRGRWPEPYSVALRVVAHLRATDTVVARAARMHQACTVIQAEWRGRRARLNMAGLQAELGHLAEMREEQQLAQERIEASVLVIQRHGRGRAVRRIMGQAIDLELATETRIDPSDGKPYTRAGFEECYGHKWQHEWDAAGAAAAESEAEGEPEGEPESEPEGEAAGG